MVQLPRCDLLEANHNQWVAFLPPLARLTQLDPPLTSHPQGNYEFGISRIIKSLEPYNKKLETDTWFYAKRCFLSLIENLAKHMITLKDSSFSEIMGFLEEAEKYGGTIPTTLGAEGKEARTVASEARGLKKMFLKLRD